jgi:hypothetical protein
MGLLDSLWHGENLIEVEVLSIFCHVRLENLTEIVGSAG